jgi:hypothetical protein
MQMDRPMDRRQRAFAAGIGPALRPPPSAAATLRPSQRTIGVTAAA